jgi:hypothetical protein
MKYFLKMINYRYQTEYSLNYHPVVSFAVSTKMPLRLRFTSLAKPEIAENVSLVNPLQTHIPEMLVVLIGRFPAPLDDLTTGSDQPAQLNTDNPAMITHTFLTDLTVTTTFPNGVNKFNAITVYYAFGCWLDQQPVSQGLVFFQHPQQPTQTGQLWKEMLPITFKPTVKSAVMYSLEAKEHPDGNDFAGIEMGILPFLDGTQLVVYYAKEPSDNFFGSHKVMFLLALLLEFAKGWHNLIYFVKIVATSN